MRLIVAIAFATIVLGITSPRSASAQNNFNGVFLGVTGGYGWGSISQTGNLPPPPAPPIPDDAKYRAGGGLFGGALGWNAQYGTWVFGIEGDYSYAAVSGQSNTCGTIPHTCGARLESLGTVRGKVGAVVNDWLVYGTGGWAFGEVSGFSVAKTSGQDTYSGWTLGAGIEKRFAPQWSLKLEYLYTDLGSRELFQAQVPGFPEHVSYKLSTLRLGISYFFEPAVASAPVIVKGPSLK